MPEYVARAGEARPAGRRGDVHDVAAVAGGHPRQRLLHPVQHAVDVDVDHAARAFVGLVGERAEVHDPGVVDEHVERAEALLDDVEEVAHRRAVGDVELDGERSVPELARREPRGGEVDVADRDLHPGAHARLRGGATDAAGAAGDRDDAAGELAGGACHGADRG